MSPPGPTDNIILQGKSILVDIEDKGNGFTSNFIGTSWDFTRLCLDLKKRRVNKMSLNEIKFTALIKWNINERLQKIYCIFKK